MPLTRAAKKVKVEVLSADLAGSTSAIVGTFAGLTATKDVALRKVVREAGGSYHVVKNKLAAKASQGSQIEAALQGLKGVSAVAYTSGDPVQLAKALSTWVKENAEFTFKLGIVDGKVISVAEIGALATLPSKEELFSKLLFLIQSPAQRLATVINATGRDLAVVLGQGVEKEKFAPGAVPVAVVAAASGTGLAEPPAVVESVVDSKASAMQETSAAPEASPTEPAVVEEPLTSAEEPRVDPETPEDTRNRMAEVQVAQTPAPSEEAVPPENGTASQAGEASTSEPVEG